MELVGDYKLCQLVGWSDSKCHPDSSRLRKLLFSKLGQEWLDAEVRYKEEAGRLWIPWLTKYEVEKLFDRVERLKDIHEGIYQAISYWDSVVVLRQDGAIPDDEGELFFEPVGGYRLLPSE